ncbi:putative RNA methyltransferase [Psychrobacter sp. Cmf 22.2]|uniref:putative RNA methyltransferase n=1 Tax=Psychrobacter sp. Cmf 22.2 TaxID=1926478 RepID=UPI000A7A6837|nr:methyltransferase domain-containing protein [Psychrobacter sp. Cmf 22.2]
MSDFELPVSLFTCPICHSPMQPAKDTWRCDGSLHPKQTSHPFDVAKQGYVNLLPVQQKKSKAPGDSQQSIDARKRFLDAGYYQPLQTLICQQMTQLLGQNDTAMNWLDIGCGEGYYTQAMAQTGMDTLIAADISKPALASLAKVSKAANYLWYQQNIDGKQTDTKIAAIYPLVTSAAHLPLRPHSMTGISSIFSPILPEAFATVLQEEGYLLIAKPDVRHLASIREALFDSVREHDSSKFLPTLAPYFELVDTHNINTSLSLPAGELADLLTMTPYAYRARPENRQALLASAETAPFITEAKFVVYVLKKRTTLS